MNYDNRLYTDLKFNNIKYYMDARSITIDELELRSGIPKSTLYGFIKGTYIPSLLDAVAIADVLYCTVYDLFFEPPHLKTLRF